MILADVLKTDDITPSQDNEGSPRIGAALRTMSKETMCGTVYNIAKDVMTRDISLPNGAEYMIVPFLKKFLKGMTNEKKVLLKELIQYGAECAEKPSAAGAYGMIKEVLDANS